MSKGVYELVNCLRELRALVRSEYVGLEDAGDADDQSLDQLFEQVLADRSVEFLEKMTPAISDLKKWLLQLQFPFADEKMKSQASA